MLYGLHTVLAVRFEPSQGPVDAAVERGNTEQSETQYRTPHPKFGTDVLRQFPERRMPSDVNSLIVKGDDDAIYTVTHET